MWPLTHSVSNSLTECGLIASTPVAYDRLLQPMENNRNYTKWAREFFVAINIDLTDILDRTNSNFENVFYYVLGPNIGKISPRIIFRFGGHE